LSWDWGCERHYRTHLGLPEHVRFTSIHVTQARVGHEGRGVDRIADRGAGTRGSGSHTIPHDVTATAFE